MAPRLERFVSPGKGNGLRATAGVRRGELLFSAEPLASCVSNRVRGDVCHRCFTRRETLLRCSQCKTARYCNITCQKQAWSVHKRECKCLRGLLPRVPTDSVRLAARLIFALFSPSKGSSKELYTLEEHESHLTSMSEQKKQGLSQLASMLELYLRQEAPDLAQEMTSSLPPSCREPLSLIAKVTCNCFTVSDGELQEIGVGLYPSLSLLNHDCRPNCVMVFEGTKLQLRAVRDIKPEEELTISYIETLSLTEDRQRQLEEQYHFTCHCQRCDSQDKDGLMLSGEEATWRLLKEALPRLEEQKAESRWEALIKSCSHFLSTVGDDLPDENLYKLRLTDMALDASVHLGHWEEAVRYGEKTLPVYRQYYPDPHPVHGVQLMRVGKLQHYLEHIADALDTFKQAFQIIKLTHGDDHPLTADLLMKMEECRSELDQKSSSSH
ncbi:histone-lysine N-methyltransferase SMYD3 isoform X1 [Scophthalmus maximus]|uniref:[histone H3]-lysine(4) N-trimethyltransferase n=2 Tax=Scophthalmus maximus TaxID=52904 RepID=A0A8D2ZWW0_SCOMX|nr:histone-lysine N-methyltransferase SMYD3 isoform X1 [Scophthalmus maximus]